jgi:hypothetical protein
MSTSAGSNEESREVEEEDDEEEDDEEDDEEDEVRETLDADGRWTDSSTSRIRRS